MAFHLGDWNPIKQAHAQLYDVDKDYACLVGVGFNVLD